MKMLMTMLAVSLVFVGCGDSDDPVAPEQEQEVVSDVTEEVDEDVVSDVDSADEGANDTTDGSAWYIGANMSF